MNKELLLQIFIIYINVLNMVLFINTKYTSINTCLILMFYYMVSMNPNKKKIVYTWFIFSVLTLMGESMFISSNQSLTYTNPDILNVPLWLMSAYANMVFMILIIYNNV